MDNTIIFNTENNEMLRVAQDGFYVRGKKVPQDESESRAVYTPSLHGCGRQGIIIQKYLSEIKCHALELAGL